MRKRVGRKLLVASLGVAAVSYVACGGGGSPVANLMPPPQDGAADTATDTASDGQRDTFSPLDIIANLVAPR
jgi:hypothetical protein